MDHDEDWYVAVVQTKPYEFKLLDAFLDEGEAIAFAEMWAGEHGAQRLDKHHWMLKNLHQPPSRRRLVVFKEGDRATAI